MSLRIGVLLPGSRILPRAEADFLDGLTAALAEREILHELVVEPTGHCAVKDMVVDKVQRMLLNHRPLVVTGIIGTGMIGHVRRFFEGWKTPLIVSNLGADVLMTGGEATPFLFHLSLNLWQSAHSLGYWAATHVGSTAGVAAGYHEAGYGMVEALALGFQSGGGRILATEVTHPSSWEDDPTPQLRHLRGLAPDLVFGLYSGREGVSFTRAWAALGRRGAPPLIATPLMVHPPWLSSMGDSALGIRTASSWNRAAWPEEDERFQNALGADPRTPPGVFALLGYEAGILIGEAAGHAGADPGEGDLRATLAGLRFSSPRGSLKVDPESGVVETEEWLFELERTGADDIQMVAAGRLERAPRYLEHWHEVRSREAKSGWINPYLMA